MTAEENETVERSWREESFNCVRQRLTCYLEVEVIFECNYQPFEAASFFGIGYSARIPDSSLLAVTFSCRVDDIFLICAHLH